MRIALLILTVASLLPATCAQNMPSPNLMPLPESITWDGGSLPIDVSFSIVIEGYNEPRLQRAAARATATLAKQTGLALRASSVPNAHATLVIATEHPSAEIQQPGEDESYALIILSSGAKLTAPNPLGALRGLQTFLQMVEVTPAGFAVPTAKVHDHARFPWRGLMIDVCRHWMPLEVIKRNLDGMEAVKLNVFHWHLSDDQGFRIESIRWPKLQELGSDGHYFTQDQVKEVVEYARDRGIRVIPEFDLPGHSTAMSFAYPELASGPAPTGIERQFGIFDPAIDPTKEFTYRFLDDFIGEMADLFPDPYFHIGGDEVNGKAWDASASIGAYLREHEMHGNAALQAYFTRRLQGIVSRHHKIMIGWDEILSPELPKSIVIQSWRGPDSLAAAAQQGFAGLLSHGFYLDLFRSAAYHYENEPISGKAAALNDEQKKLILGGEACMWSELVTPDTIDSRIWPRLAVIAERLWSPQDPKDIASMYVRMEAESERLEFLGLKHRSYYVPMLERLAGSTEIGPLKTLADVVQAPPDYKREELHVAAVGREFTSLDAYNRLVDASHPESMVAVDFAKSIDDLIAHRATAEEQQKLRALLTKWRDNDAELQTALHNSFLLREDEPLSKDLSAVSAAALQALGYFEHGAKPPRGWVEQQLTLLSRAKEPHAELLLAVVAPVEKLIHALPPAR